MNRSFWIIALALAALTSCQSIAAVTQLPVEAAREIGFEQEDVEIARLAESELPIERYEIERVEGSGLSFVLDGTPRDVLAMLLDFEGANGRREWCERYKAVSVGEGTAEAVWYFKRYKIFKPVVTLLYEFEESNGGDRIVIDFHAAAPVPGVAALFGQYQLYALEGEIDETLMRAQVFIDTGLPIDVDQEDVEEGLRTDAKNLRAWIRERLHSTQ